MIGHPRTSVSVWGHAQRSQWDRHSWCLLGKGQGCGSVPYNVRYSHTQRRISYSSMSQAPRLRNSTVTVNWITALFRQKNTDSSQSRFRSSGQLLWLLSVFGDVDVETGVTRVQCVIFEDLATCSRIRFHLDLPRHHSKYPFLQGPENPYWALASGSVHTTATHRRRSNTIILQEGAIFSVFVKYFRILCKFTYMSVQFSCSVVSDSL